MSAQNQVLAHELLSEPVFEPALPASERDYVALIEAAYDLAADDRAWLLGVVRAACPIVDRGLGVFGYFWDLSRDGKLSVAHPTYVGCPPAMHAGLLESGQRLTAGQARSFYMEGNPCKLLNAGVAAEQYPRAYASYRAHTRSGGFVAVSSADLTRTGCMLGAARAQDTVAAPSLGRALDQVARHIVAGMRLRRALRGGATGAALDSADAVLDAKGQILHVEPQVAGRRERGSFVSAARRLLDSRGVRRSRPEQAVELWRALVLGRWSLVDHTDNDGKRFLLARRNAPGAHEPAALSEEERRAAALFSLLGSVKLVAYELGLAPSTISEELKSACRKLGCRDRSELAGLLQAKPRVDSDHA